MGNTLTMPSVKQLLPRLLPDLQSHRLISGFILRPLLEFLQNPFVCTAALSFAAGTFAIAVQNAPPKRAPPPPLVLAGGTIIDVTEWGHSANDIQDAIIYIRDGHILAVGPRASLPIPKGSQVIDCTGKYLIPGLIDGYAGMTSQGQANANLYMGVTTVVATASDRHGWSSPIDQQAHPSPHLYLLDSIGSTDDWSLLINQPD